MNTSPSILTNGREFFSNLPDKMIWASIKGIGMGLWLAVKLLWLPFLILLLGWIAFTFLMRWIDEGELPVSLNFEWLRSFAGWISKHRHWWSGIIIGAAGSGLWEFVKWIF